MSDPSQMPGQPSQEEMRAYLEQLRAADPVGLLAEAFNLLATGAQVKLGRPDARVLIDAMAGMVQSAGANLPAEIAQQMNDGIGQLQLAQVQAEKDAAAAAPQAAQGAAASATTDAPQPGAAGSGAAGGPGPAGGQRMTDRLWVPGRDPNPPPAR